ncbi:MAG: peptide chain release factor N(5)-glutamine methyltransferase [Candidatus Latescibacterota bacterium]
MEDNTWTVLRILNWTTDYLDKKGIEHGRLNAERMLGHALGMSRLDLYLKFDRPLCPNERSVFKSLLSKRTNGLPLQYVLGETEFFSLPFSLRPPVLIPRPETEILVQTALDRLRCREGALTVADIGTGSGNIAIALTVHLESLMAIATDCSAEAIALAGENALRNGVSDRITFLRGDLLNPLSALNLPHGLDAILSNPPYVRTAQCDTLPPEIRDHESRTALDGGPDGLHFYRRLAEGAGRYLAPDGFLLVEVGDGQAGTVQDLFREEGPFRTSETIEDLNGIERVIAATR